MEHRVEPQSWLSEGVAPEEVNAEGAAPAAAAPEEVAADPAAPVADDDVSLNGSGTAADADPEPRAPAPQADAFAPAVSADLFTPSASEAPAEPASPSAASPPPDPSPAAPSPDPLSYGETGSFLYEPSDTYGYQEHPQAAQDQAASGYNQDVTSQHVGEQVPAPPLPAELPYTPSAPSGGTFASAAFRAVTRPTARPRPAPSPVPRPGSAAQPRRADLVIARFEPWSVMKFSFLMSLVAWLVLFVAVALLYYLLSGLGVFTDVQRTLESVTSSQTSAGVDLARWTSASRVLGYTMLVGALNVIIITALCTVGAMVYNLVTRLGGGVEVTLRETDRPT